MKEHRFVLPKSLLMLAIVFAAQPLLAEVYRVVDADGNVSFTDTAPGPDAKPMELRGLSIISPQRPNTPATTPAAGTPEEPKVGGQQEVTSLRELRNGYSDFSLVTPTQDQTIWSTENSTAIAWNTQFRLQDGMTVTVYLDGVARAPSTQAVSDSGRLDRGTHEVYAELRDVRNRRIATTDRVTFHVRQNTVNQTQGG